MTTYLDIIAGVLRRRSDHGHVRPIPHSAATQEEIRSCFVRYQLSLGYDNGHSGEPRPFLFMTSDKKNTF